MIWEETICPKNGDDIPIGLPYYIFLRSLSLYFGLNSKTIINN